MCQTRKTRLGLYRRMADMRKFTDLDSLVEEFKDRFGAPPEAVNNLFLQLKVKLMAEKAGLASITVENGQFVLRFPEGEILKLTAGFRMRRCGWGRLRYGYHSLGDDWSEVLLDTLDRLQDTVYQTATETA